MTLPFDHRVQDPIEPSLPVSRSTVGNWTPLRDRWPVLTIALGASFTIAWLGALIVLLALRI
jgi:hypothetical protein